MRIAADRTTVRDAMHRGVVTCDVETPLTKVAQMMVGHRIHCVVGNSAEEPSPRLWGVISDLDVAFAYAGDVAEATPAGEIAATPAVTIGAGEPLRRAAQLMSEHGVTHLVVVDSAARGPSACFRPSTSRGCSPTASSRGGRDRGRPGWRHSMRHRALRVADLEQAHLAEVDVRERV